MPTVLKCLCHGIILDGTLETCYTLAKPHKTWYKNRINTITKNYGEESVIQTNGSWGILFILITITYLFHNKH